MCIRDSGYLEKKMSDTVQCVKNHKKVDFLNNVHEADITHLLNFNFYIKKFKKRVGVSLNPNSSLDLLKDNLEVLNNATEQYEILFKQGIQDPATVINYFEDKLPNLKGEFIGLFVPKLLDKFSAEIISTEAAEVKQNPVTLASRDQIINNIFKRSNVKQWRTWSVPKRKALMKQITGTEVLAYEDGFTFEQIEAYIDAGWLDDERLEELFRDPLDWEGIIDK